MAEITVAQLTDLNSKGVFDILAKSVLAELKSEFSGGRIAATEYAKVYATTLDAILGQSIQFLLQKDISAEQALLLEAQRHVAVAQEQNIQKEILLTVANTAKVTKETQLLDKQEDLLDAQIALTIANRQKVEHEVDVLAAQLDKLEQEVLLTVAQTDIANKNVAILAAQVLNVPKEGVVLDKQALKLAEEIIFLSQRIKTEKAQISDSVDGVSVAGILGRQRELYTAQSDGFKRDAEFKVLSKLVDAWVVRRSTDDTGTIADGTNKLSDANIGLVVAKAMAGIGVSPSNS